MRKTKFNVGGWILTDPSCNQYRKDITKTIFLFKEDRLINPITKETQGYQAEIDLDDYSLFDMIDNCSPYGYEKEEVTEWFKNSINLDLIAECIFEQLND